MASGDTKTEAMLNVLGNGGSGDEFRGCCNTKTQQYILDAIDRINELDPGSGGSIEYVDLTPTGVTLQGISVTASEYMDDVIAMSEDDKRVVFRVTLPAGTGLPTSGTYELPMFNYEENIKTLAMTVVSLNGDLYAINFGYDTSTPSGAHTTSGIIMVELVPTGGGVNIVQTTGTSETDVMSQKAVSEMVFADPSTKNKVQIASGAAAGGGTSIAIGTNAQASTLNGIAIGANSAVLAGKWNSVALGSSAIATRSGEVYVGASYTTQGYNSTEYRVIGGVYDGQDAHDAATVGQALGTDESYTIATGDWTALSASSPYTYQATVTATYTIGNDTTVELINDAPVTFGNYGFAIGSVSGQNVTIYSIGQPSASVTLKVNYKG